jgi:hypothetical protein
MCGFKIAYGKWQTAAGYRLRFRFAIRPPPCIGLGFPGTPLRRSTASAAVPAP